MEYIAGGVFRACASVAAEISLADEDCVAGLAERCVCFDPAARKSLTSSGLRSERQVSSVSLDEILQGSFY